MLRLRWILAGISAVALISELSFVTWRNNVIDYGNGGKNLTEKKIPEDLSYDSEFDPEIVAAQYNIMPKPCSAFVNDTFLLMISSSRPSAEGFKVREAIRKTWGSVAETYCGVRLLFIFGRVFDGHSQMALDGEAAKYGDIIQSDQFHDGYHASAILSISLLQWAATFCPDSVFTAKLDDDTWVNLPKYYQFLKNNQHNDYVYGTLFGAGSRVIRDPSHKNYVPREEFEPDFYPEYVSGMLFAFPTRFLRRVVHAARTLQVTFNDDVYITGVVANAVNLTRSEVPDYGWDHTVNDTLCPKLTKTCIHYTKLYDFDRVWNDPCGQYASLC